MGAIYCIKTSDAGNRRRKRFMAVIERDSDAIATTTLLRAPAAVIAGAYVVGLAIGESARPLSADPLSIGFYLCTALVLLPFMLPARWFERAPAVLNAWLVAGAIIATARAAFMAGWLFPRLPLTSWMTKLLLDLVLVAALWLAALGARRFHAR
jgi:hypothetical protein